MPSPLAPPEKQIPQFLDDVAPEFGPPDSVLDEEQLAREAATRAANEERLQLLGADLAGKFRDCETKRQRIEDRWLEDLRQYHGRYDPGIEQGLVDAESCSLFLNITKPKTHAFAARVMDLALPTDEKNWGISQTPVPEMSQLAQSEAPAVDPRTQEPLTAPNGAPVLHKDLAKGLLDEAADRADAMEEELDDQLSECDYNAIQRKVIEQMSRLGTGVIMGPVILDEWRVKWTAKDIAGKRQWLRELVPNDDKRPGAQWVDVWNYYPDMSANAPDECGFAFVQYLVNKTTLKRYAKRYNFMEGALKRVLEGTPFNVSTLRWMNELRDMSETQTFTDNRYRLLRYYGEIEAEDLRAVDIDPESIGVSETVWGVVWMCDGVVLKVDINPLDSGELPFSVAYCDKDEASPFGIGIPRLMRGEQESVNSAWRMKHDNAGLSVCPQTVLKFDSVTPADGDYHMKPKKVWYAADDTVDVNRVFAQFSIDSHQAELDNILQLAIRFADDVTQLPLLMQGDQAPHITQTAQGMSLLYNASTVVLRRTIKFYDDYVTVPLIKRFYEWNMQFNPKESIKGDFKIIARGSSTLLDKEQQSQALDMAMQFASTPTWQPYTDMKKLYQQALKAKRIQDIILDDESIKANLERQAQQAAAMAQSKAPAGPAPAAADPLAQQKLDLEREKIALAREAGDREERLMVAKFALDRDMSLDKAQAAIAAVKIRESAANDRASAELAIKSRMGTGI